MPIPKHIALVGLLLSSGCAENHTRQISPPASSEEHASPGLAPTATEGKHEVALVAGGCFWCIESVYDETPGVLSAVSGYSGGAEPHPTYRQVSSSQTGHAEVVRVIFDATTISYNEILWLLWHNIDPFQRGGQFCDHGPQYRSAIYYSGDTQRKAAESTRANVETHFGRSVATEISMATTFWPAEDYHQNFHEKNPARYQSYRTGCGRDRRLAEVWKRTIAGDH